jgi:CRISPR-associated endonuclease/helicase Cas3
VLGPRIKNNSCTNALQLNDCLAKTYKTSSGEKRAGRRVLNHCQIVGEVARGLLNRLPDWLVTELFPKGSELIAGAQDIGKVTARLFRKKFIVALKIIAIIPNPD